ncbi:MAG: hypothetical protein ABIH65_02525 [Nanoarchaeota archaeon]
MNFIKEIFQSKSSWAVHKQFIRFGKGEYNKKALLSLWKTKNVKIKSSFEFTNDLVLFIAGLNNAIFNGIILSKEEIKELSGIKKEGKWVYNVSNFTSNQIKKIADGVYYFLLNADGSGIKLRIKSKLPKPGKSENKVDNKFCQLELDEKYYRDAKEDFFWDLPEFKKATVEHKFIINEIIQPKTNETDYAKIRELAKRKGKIIRVVDVDGKEIRKEIEFEA